MAEEFQRNTIACGDAIEVMRQMLDDSVQCVVTSPPYWGLRDYGNPPRVWGGEAGCEHEWGSERHIAGEQRSLEKMADKSTLGIPRDGSRPRKCTAANQQYSAVVRDGASQGQFCQHCGAWLGCLGLEPTPELYVAHLVDIFREVKRVLRDDGTVWLNMGDSYASSGKGGPVSDRASWHGGGAYDELELGRAPTPPGLKPKDLCGIPWRVAFALQADGWWLRSDIIWHKPNCMPESVRDRPTKAHEYVFLLSKAKRYYYDGDAIREAYKPGSVGRYEYALMGTAPTARQPGGDVGRRERDKGIRSPNPAGRNRRTVWTIPTQPYSGAHFAVFPERLIGPCIKAGTSERGACPECGAGWVRVVDRAKWGVAGSESVYPEDSNAKNLSLSRQFYRKEYGTEGPPSPMTTGWCPTCTCYNTDPLSKYPKQDKQETDEDYAARIAPIQVERLRLLKEFALLPTQPSLVFDPFMGAGTTALVAAKLGRHYYGAEINAEYIILANERIEKTQLRFLF